LTLYQSLTTGGDTKREPHKAALEASINSVVLEKGGLSNFRLLYFFLWTGENQSNPEKIGFL